MKIMSIVSRIGYFLKDFAPFLFLFVICSLAFVVLTFKIYKSKSKNRQKKLLLSASVLIFALLVGSIGLEAYFRYSYDVPDGLGFLNVSRKWNQRHVIYNNYFYRDRDFSTEKNPDSKRIGIIGDSITFGAGIENAGDRFSNLLEKKLREGGAQVEVYNLGRPGADLEDEILDFEKVKHLKFDVVVWQYFLNDIQPKTESTGTRIIETNRDTPAFVKLLSKNSYFFDFLYWRLSPRYQKTFSQLQQADIDLYGDPFYLNRHKNQISNFASVLSQNNTQLIVVIFPLLDISPNDYPLGIHDIVNDHFRENKVETIDLLAEFGKYGRNDLMASKFDPHPNEAAHAIVAEKLFPRVRELLSK